MTECDEVAAALADRYTEALAKAMTVSSMAHARALVKKLMPDEGATLVDNVAESLHRNRARVEKLIREAETDARMLVDHWEAKGVIVTIGRHPLEPLAMRHNVAYVEARIKR